jgi:FtsH-binding integral membrane protein
MDTKVFSRTVADGAIISSRAYNLIMGLVLCWGFFINWLMVKYIAPETIANLTGGNSFVFFIGYLASCFFGVYLYTKSDKPLVSFLGYNFVVLPFGLIINLAVNSYEPEIVLEAIRITGFVTVIMMILGTLFPKFFQKIAGALSIALIIVIIVEVVEVFIFKVHHGILDWVVVLIFCGYIGYDWGRANRIPKTVDNAIDSAAALYMDIIILFLRILSILGRRR